MLGVVVVTFLLLRLIPGDPARTLLGLHAPSAAVAALRHQLGLDEPIWRQFWHYLYALAHGNLGTSIYYQAPVASLIPPCLALDRIARAGRDVLRDRHHGAAWRRSPRTRQDRAGDHAVGCSR